MNIVKYIPSTYPKVSWKVKIIFGQLILISVLLNFMFVRQIYTLRCMVNGEKIGFFITKSQCDDLVSSKMDSLLLATKNYQNQNGY